jgi:hypothetical protein
MSDQFLGLKSGQKRVFWWKKSIKFMRYKTDKIKLGFFSTGMIKKYIDPVLSQEFQPVACSINTIYLLL